MKRTIICVIGTRPEAIKMAPVILALKENPAFRTFVLATGQHTDMLDQALSFFDIKADVNLHIMKDRQTLDHITSRVLVGTGEIYDKEKPDLVLVHGDTTTTLGASMSAFYRKIPVGHVEAGLRSGNLDQPFPEEANRILTDRLTTLFFAPTNNAKDNLLSEKVAETQIFVTGNTVIDALAWTVNEKRGNSPERMYSIPSQAPLILMTAHRRESWGKPLENICEAIQVLLEKLPDVYFLIPLHKNPTVREVIKKFLGNMDRVIFTEPLDYPDFVQAMKRSYLILSDSGGVQEEASYLKKPVLIMRNISERPEAIDHGTGILVGTDKERIVKETLRLFSNGTEYDNLIKRSESPFGYGTAAKKIECYVSNFFNQTSAF